MYKLENWLTCFMSDITFIAKLHKGSTRKEIRNSFNYIDANILYKILTN